MDGINNEQFTNFRKKRKSKIMMMKTQIKLAACLTKSTGMKCTTTCTPSHNFFFALKTLQAIHRMQQLLVKANKASGSQRNDT